MIKRKNRSTAICTLLCLITVLAATALGDLTTALVEDRLAAVEADYIRWVDLSPSVSALRDTAAYDIDSYGTAEHIGWVELLACLACKNGGDFSHYTKKDLTRVVELINESGIASYTAEKKHYRYFLEAYGAALSGLIGEYEVNGAVSYGVIGRHPIARGYSFSHFDDFGTARSYGYKRKHLGHDLMGAVGTPIVAIEGGYVEAMGWNRYGGWRVGIRSFDGKRYYYYAHLRKNHPYNDIYEGKQIEAGEVIGYMGMTGYSDKENVNNINTPHLHLGLQLIFDPSQKDGANQIWVDLYPLMQFLSDHTSRVRYDETAKEYYATAPVRTLNAPD